MLLIESINASEWNPDRLRNVEPPPKEEPATEDSK
jgi:hypothetical protein